MQAFNIISHNHLVADLISIVGTSDFVLGSVDRSDNIDRDAYWIAFPRIAWMIGWFQFRFGARTETRNNQSSQIHAIPISSPIGYSPFIQSALRSILQSSCFRSQFQSFFSWLVFRSFKLHYSFSFHFSFWNWFLEFKLSIPEMEKANWEIEVGMKNDNWNEQPKERKIKRIQLK